MIGSLKKPALPPGLYASDKTMKGAVKVYEGN